MFRQLNPTNLRPTRFNSIFGYQLEYGISACAIVLKLLTSYGTTRHGTTRYGTTRYGTTRYGTTRYGTVFQHAAG